MHENKFLFKQYGAGLGFDLRHSDLDYASASKSYRGRLPDRDRCNGINLPILKLLAENEIPGHFDIDLVINRFHGDRRREENGANFGYRADSGWINFKGIVSA